MDRNTSNTEKNARRRELYAAKKALRALIADWESRIEYIKGREGKTRAETARALWRAAQKRTKAIYSLYENWEFRGGNDYLHNAFYDACNFEQECWNTLCNALIDEAHLYNDNTEEVIMGVEKGGRYCDKMQYKKAWRLLRLDRQGKIENAEDLRALELLIWGNMDHDKEKTKQPVKVEDAWFDHVNKILTIYTVDKKTRRFVNAEKWFMIYQQRQFLRNGEKLENSSNILLKMFAQWAINKGYLCV